MSDTDSLTDTDRRNIKVTAEVFDRLAADKRDDETWSGYLARLHVRRTDSVGTQESIAAIEEQLTRLPDEVADELETRLR